MSDVMLARLAIAANLMFWPLLFVMAAIRSDYSHLHQAVSELGAVGAPHMWAWNILGYVVPGLMLAVFGWSLVRRLRPGSRVAAALLALSGIGMAAAGLIPADMNDRRGLLTSLHIVGSSLSVLAWLPSMIVVAALARRTRPEIAVASGVALAAMIGSFALYGVWEDTPALVQRITFGVYLGWYLVAGLLLTVRAPQAVLSAKAR
jgi:hypothetical membrane protein